MTPPLPPVTRDAELSKADLVTNMVVEMTSLQGIIGEIYAKKSGESDAVAKAIREQYLPRSSGDAPTRRALPGLALGLADKLDSLAGLFSPGSRHPHRQRRSLWPAAGRLGIVNNLIATETDFDVPAGLAAAVLLATGRCVLMLPHWPRPNASSPAVWKASCAKWAMPTMWSKRCWPCAVTILSPPNGPAMRSKRHGGAGFVAATPSRPMPAAVRITRKLDEAVRAQPGRLSQNRPSSRSTTPIPGRPREPGWTQADDPAPHGVGRTVAHCCKRPIPELSENVLVNAEDEDRARLARLALVQRIADLPEKVGDLSKLQGF